MIIFWKGLGFLVVFFVILAGIAASLLANHFTGDPHYAESHHWVMGAAFLAAGVASFIVGIKANSNPGRVLIDPRTRQRVVLRRRHTLFFINMEYWAVVVAIFGIVVIFDPQIMDKNAPPAVSATDASQQR
jgi:hypothetical protein